MFRSRRATARNLRRSTRTCSARPPSSRRPTRCPAPRARATDAPPTAAQAPPPQRKPRPRHTSLLHAHGALVLALAKSGRKLDVSLPFIGNRTVNSTAGQFIYHSMKGFRITNTNLLELQIQIEMLKGHELSRRRSFRKAVGNISTPCSRLKLLKNY